MTIVENELETPLRPSEAPARPAPDDATRFVGRPIPRLDGALKVRGQARFAAEVPFERLAYGALVHSSIARGRIAEIDTAAAEAAPGVLLVMTYRNAPRLKPPLLMMADPKGASASNLPVMQDDRIHWNGEPVAAVLAETQEQADHAATLVRVRYEAEAAATGFEEAKAKAHPPENILGEPSSIAVGDAEAALSQAPFKVDQVFRTPRHNHCAIELHAVTVAWEGGHLLVHDATQMVHLARGTLAAVFDIPEDHVRVLSPFVGGGFGNKAVWNHHVIAAAAARLLDRPVRMVLTREGVFRATGGRTVTEQRVALGARADGTLAALIHTGFTAVTAHNSCPEQFTIPARHLYAAETMHIAQQVTELDMVANTFMRAPGESVGTFALESAIDELAVAMALDPIELRRRIEPARDPTSGKRFSARHLLQAYERGAQRFGWNPDRPAPGSRRDGEWLIGQGVATATYPYFRMPGGAASIRLGIDGRAVVKMGAHEMGMGTATAQTQHAAQLLALPMDRVRFDYGDSDLPTGTIAGGSSQSASIIATVRAAFEALVSQLLVLADDTTLAGLRPEDVEARDGGLGVCGDPSRHVSYVTILRRAGRDALECRADSPAPAEMEKFSMHSYGAQFCEVRVSAVTGETRVSRWVGSFDTGRILNPKTAASQFRGGIVMGLGLALSEETLFDERSGRIMNPSLADYHVPVHLDVPPIEVIWNDIPDPHSPLGLHGIGEIGITGVGAAVANAVYNATGKRVRELPVTLDKLL